MTDATTAIVWWLAGGLAGSAALFIAAIVVWWVSIIQATEDIDVPMWKRALWGVGLMALDVFWTIFWVVMVCINIALALGGN